MMRSMGMLTWRSSVWIGCISNAYVPTLQVPGQVARFLHDHLAHDHRELPRVDH